VVEQDQQNGDARTPSRVGKWRSLTLLRAELAGVSKDPSTEIDGRTRLF